MAYPDNVFPNISEGAKCLLCQQPLIEGKDRMLRFDKFILQSTEQTLQDKKRKLTLAESELLSQKFILDIKEEEFTELLNLDKKLAENSKKYEQELMNRKNSILQAIKDGIWEKVVPLPTSIAEDFSKLKFVLNVEADLLVQTLENLKRNELVNEHIELGERRKLADNMGSIKNLITSFQLQEKLKKCLSDLNPRAITNKVKELTDKVISEELAKALNKEFKTLGVHNLNVVHKSTPTKGKVLHKLKLNYLQKHNPTDILSEGEQRAIAIASFLAEVELGGHKGGIIFDDPVSSLDHKHRDKVAARFAKESEKRQVIVFTHDIYFASLLIE